MAQDALGLMLSGEEIDGIQIPKASSAKDIELSEGASLVLIEVNSDDFREAV
jgi:antitoxin HicB